MLNIGDKLVCKKNCHSSIKGEVFIHIGDIYIVKNVGISYYDIVSNTGNYEYAFSRNQNGHYYFIDDFFTELKLLRNNKLERLKNV